VTIEDIINADSTKKSTSTICYQPDPDDHTWMAATHVTLHRTYQARLDESDAGTKYGVSDLQHAEHTPLSFEESSSSSAPI